VIWHGTPYRVDRAGGAAGARSSDDARRGAAAGAADGFGEEGW
jgi:hypothetical protein